VTVVIGLITAYNRLTSSLQDALDRKDFVTASKIAKYGVHASDNTLRNAVGFDDLSTVQWLISHHEPPNASLNSMLVSAIISDKPNSLGILKLLLDAGADPNATDSRTPVIFTALSNPKALDLLLDRGANVNADYGTGNTPIQMAALWGRFKAIPVLARHGADLNEPGLNGMTPLTVAHHVWANASPADYKATYYALLASGADPKAWSSDCKVAGIGETWPGSPPLHAPQPSALLTGQGAMLELAQRKQPNDQIRWWSIQAQPGDLWATAKNPKGVSVVTLANGQMSFRLPPQFKHWEYDVTVCTDHEKVATMMDL
jgi:hypothetical protein